MSDDIQGGEILKPETAEILKELEAEGNTIEGRESSEPKVEEPAVEAKVEEPQKPQEAEPEPEVVEDEPDTPAKVDREVKAVPVQKYNALRHEVQELKKQLADKPQASTPSQAPDIADAVSKLAEKHGIDAEILSDIASTIADEVGRKVAMPEDYKEAIEKMQLMTRTQQEETAYNADFDKVATQLADEGLDVTGHKDKIKQLAYTEGYTSTSLRAIALEYAHDNGLLSKGRKTAESSSGGRALAETTVIDFDSISEEEAKKLPDDQWEKYVEHQIKTQHTGQGIR